VAEQGKVLRAYLTHTSCWLQVVGFIRLVDDPMRVQDTFQNWDKN
jgi:hypothetical protein